MAGDGNVVRLSNASAAREGAVYRQVRELATDRLRALLREMLDQVDDLFFDHAEKAGNNQDQQVWFEAMREVRRGRRELEEQFLAGLDGAFRGRPPAPRAGPEGDDDELALVDAEEEERFLAIDGMISKARTRLSIPLDHLCQRFNAEADRKWADPESNPVDPHAICRILEEVSGGLELNIQPRLVLYKLFDRVVVGQLDGLYGELNQCFIDAGILPRVPTGGAVRSRGASAPPRGAARGSNTPGQTPQGEHGEAFGDQGGEDAFAVLQNLLAAQRGNTEWSGSGYVPAQPARIEDVLGALSQLQGQIQPNQAGAESGGAVLSPEVLRQHVRQGLESADGAAALGQAEDDTIEIVSLLFSTVLEDDTLPDRVRALLARLQIPVLKVALLDRDFFSSAEHPARVLVNELASAGIGLSDEEHEAEAGLRATMEHAVDRVVHEFADDPSVFRHVLEEFRAVRKAEEDRIGQIEARTREAAEGRARVDGAREQVDALLNERIAANTVPECVERLLRDGWSQVMFLTLLRSGGESDAWRHQVDVMDRLLWSVQPKADADERRRLVRELPPLLSDLRTELNDILFNSIEMTRLFEALEHEHIQTLSRPAEARPDEADDGPVATEEASEATAANESAEEFEPGEGLLGTAEDPLDAYRERLDQVQVGTWFELSDDSGRTLRAKLSARLNDGDRLVFVNRAGFKLADRRRDELAGALRDGAVVLLDDNMLFDKALENVVANLRSMRDAR